MIDYPPRLPDENNVWYARFCEWLDMGEGTQITEYLARKNPNSKSKSGSFFISVRRYEWQKRAEKYFSGLRREKRDKIMQLTIDRHAACIAKVYDAIDSISRTIETSSKYAERISNQKYSEQNLKINAQSEQSDTSSAKIISHADGRAIAALTSSVATAGRAIADILAIASTFTAGETVDQEPVVPPLPPETQAAIDEQYGYD